MNSVHHSSLPTIEMDKRLGLGVINTHDHGCMSFHEINYCLDITEIIEIIAEITEIIEILSKEYCKLRR